MIPLFVFRELSVGYIFVLLLDLVGICTKLMTESWNVPSLGKVITFNRDKCTIIREIFNKQLF